MNLQYRVEILEKLGNYILSDSDEWLEIKQKASIENGWFIPEFINKACENIAACYLDKSAL